MSKYFCKNLKYLRTIKKISQQELADKLKINRSTISRYENNDIEPTIENVIEIANVLGIPVADLVGIDIQQDGYYTDEFEELFLKNKEILNSDDIDTIKFIIEKRKKEHDSQE